jgi:hypothetical protein
MTESRKVKWFEFAAAPQSEVYAFALVNNFGLKFCTHFVIFCFWKYIYLNSDFGVVGAKFNSILNQMIKNLLVKSIVQTEWSLDLSE